MNLHYCPACLQTQQMLKKSKKKETTTNTRLVHPNLHETFECHVYDVTSVLIKMAAGGNFDLSDLRADSFSDHLMTTTSHKKVRCEK